MKLKSVMYISILLFVLSVNITGCGSKEVKAARDFMEAGFWRPYPLLMRD